MKLSNDSNTWIHESEFLNSTKSTTTKRAYSNSLRQFAAWLQSQTPILAPTLTPDVITTDALIGYHQYLLEGHSCSTSRVYLAAIFSFLNYLEQMHDVEIKADLPKVKRRQQWQRRQKKEVKETPAEKAKRLQAKVPILIKYIKVLPLVTTGMQRIVALRDRAIVLTLHSTACRIAELLSLNRDIGTKPIILGKGRRLRTLHINHQAKKAITTYLQTREDKSQALFISYSNRTKGQRLSDDMVRKSLHSLSQTVGIDPHIRPHDFRRYRATELLRKGMPITALQEFLGHSSIEITRRTYAPVLGEHIVAKWLNQLPGEEYV